MHSALKYMAIVTDIQYQPSPKITAFPFTKREITVSQFKLDQTTLVGTNATLKYFYLIKTNFTKVTRVKLSSIFPDYIKTWNIPALTKYFPRGVINN